MLRRTTLLSMAMFLSAIPAIAQEKPAAAPAVDLGVELVASGLEKLTFLTAVPGDPTRLFVTEQEGRIMIIEDGVLLVRPFLDINDRVLNSGERGLLSLAFDPDYENNLRFYINYTDNSGNTVVSRFLARKKNRNVARKGSESVILRINQPYSNHNGGQLQFGPDGYLYVGMGDGGSAGDPLNSGQDLTTRLGKLLRIDVKELPYTIPSTNPYVNSVATSKIA